MIQMTHSGIGVAVNDVFPVSAPVFVLASRICNHTLGTGCVICAGLFGCVIFASHFLFCRLVQADDAA